MTLHKTGSGLNSACLVVAPVPQVNPVSSLCSMALEAAWAFLPSGGLLWSGRPPEACYSRSSVPQGGIPEEDQSPLRLHTPAGAGLGCVSLHLAALLLGCLVALGFSTTEVGTTTPVTWPLLAVGTLEADGGDFCQLSSGLPTSLLEGEGLMAPCKAFASPRLTIPYPPHTPPLMSPATDPSRSTCLTEACIQWLEKSWSPWTGEPCEDFYQFSCGLDSEKPST